MIEWSRWFSIRRIYEMDDRLYMSEEDQSCITKNLRIKGVGTKRIVRNWTMHKVMILTTDFEWKCNSESWKREFILRKFCISEQSFQFWTRSLRHFCKNVLCWTPPWLYGISSWPSSWSKTPCRQRWRWPIVGGLDNRFSEWGSKGFSYWVSMKYFECCIDQWQMMFMQLQRATWFIFNVFLCFPKIWSFINICHSDDSTTFDVQKLMVTFCFIARKLPLLIARPQRTEFTLL
jgi:hypothetical protein